jgi:hypothetical protein
MKKHTFKVIAGALLLSTTTLAGAQQSLSRAQAFAAQFKEWQALTGSTASTFKPRPILRAEPDDPVGHESFAERFASLQAQSSNSAQFQSTPTFTAQAADAVGHPSFAEYFAQMQAASSNGGVFRSPAGAEETETAYASAKAAIDKPLLAQRLANFLHRLSKAFSPSGQ